MRSRSARTARRRLRQRAPRRYPWRTWPRRARSARATTPSALVVLAQDLEHLGPGKLRRHFGAFLEPLAKLRARDLELILRFVRAGASRRHAVAAVAPERDVHLERLRLERARWNLVEHAVRIERPVVLADAGMVAPHDQMRAAVVLAEKRVQQRLARTGVAHVERVAG